MDYKIIDIFPTAIMKFKFNREFNEIELDFVKANELKCNKNFGNKSSKNSYILDEAEMSDIKAFCNKSIEIYFEEIYKPFGNIKIKLTQSWLNYTTKGGYHHMHTHPNSIVSGVLYIDTDDEKDSISFSKINYKQIEILQKELNDYNSDEVYFKAKKYELLLFPSHLNHRVSNTTSSNTRISLAFNSFVEGELGTLSGLNYLKL